MSEQVSLCKDIENIDFGIVTSNSERSASLVIFNSNPIPAKLGRIMKADKDSLTVEIDRVLNRQGEDVEPFFDSLES